MLCAIGPSGIEELENVCRGGGVIAPLAPMSMIMFAIPALNVDCHKLAVTLFLYHLFAGRAITCCTKHNSIIVQHH